MKKLIIGFIYYVYMLFSVGFSGFVFLLRHRQEARGGFLSAAFLSQSPAPGGMSESARVRSPE